MENSPLLGRSQNNAQKEKKIKLEVLSKWTSYFILFFMNLAAIGAIWLQIEEYSLRIRSTTLDGSIAQFNCTVPTVPPQNTSSDNLTSPPWIFATPTWSNSFVVPQKGNRPPLYLHSNQYQSPNFNDNNNNNNNNNNDENSIYNSRINYHSKIHPNHKQQIIAKDGIISKAPPLNSKFDSYSYMNQYGEGNNHLIGDDDPSNSSAVNCTWHTVWYSEIANLSPFYRFMLVGLNLEASKSSYINLTFEIRTFGWRENYTTWDLVQNETLFYQCSTSTCVLDQIYFTDYISYTDYVIELIPESNFQSTLLADVQFVYTYHDSDFTKIELITTACCGFITILFGAIWLWQVRKQQIQMLPEQRWVTMLLLGILLYQNPLFIVSTIFPYQYYLFVSAIAVKAFAVSYTFVFWLMVMDGLSYAKNDYKFCTFYLLKLLLGTVWWISSFFSTLWFSELIHNGGGSTFYDTQYWVWLVASAMDVMATMVWLVWFLFVFYRTRQTLRVLPFLSTRYRQLSFRFFSFLNFSSILFGFFVLAFSIYAGVKADTLTYFEITNQYGSMSVLLISTIYVLFVAFVFLPPQAKFLMIAADYDFVITEQELRDRKKFLEAANYGTQRSPSITTNSRPPSEPVMIGDSTNAGLGSLGKSEMEAAASKQEQQQKAHRSRVSIQIDKEKDSKTARNSVQLEESGKTEVKPTTTTDTPTSPPLPSTTTTQTAEHLHNNNDKTETPNITRKDSKQEVVEEQKQKSKAWSTYQDILSDEKKVSLPPTVTQLQTPHQRSSTMSVLSTTSHNRESNTTTNSFAKPSLQRSSTVSSTISNNNNNNSPQISDRTGLLSGREKDPNQTSARRRTGAFISNAASTFLEGLQKRMRAPVTKVFCLETAAWLFEFAWQAYFDPPGIKTASGCGPIDFGNVQKMGFKYRGFVSNDVVDVHAVMCVRKRTVVIAFRGTASKQAFRTDLAWTTVEIPHREGRFELFHPRVHLGFWTGFQKLWPELSQLIQDYQNEHSGQKLRVFFTGHSLGGALATLAAFELKVMMPNASCSLYTFGCPRVGNTAFSNAFNQTVDESFRISNDLDFVTGIPKFLWVFKHVNKEVILDRFGNIILDLSPVERAFSGSKSSIVEHSMNAYRANLLACFELHLKDRKMPEVYHMLKNTKAAVRESTMAINTLAEENQDSPEDLVQSMGQGVARVLFGTQQSTYNRALDQESTEYGSMHY